MRCGAGSRARCRHIRLDNLYGPTETTIAVLHRQTPAEDGEAVIVPIRFALSVADGLRGRCGWQRGAGRRAR
jgi:non-ribosomal peptide synthetase component F